MMVLRFWGVPRVIGRYEGALVLKCSTFVHLQSLGGFERAPGKHPGGFYFAKFAFWGNVFVCRLN